MLLTSTHFEVGSQSALDSGQSSPLLGNLTVNMFDEEPTPRLVFYLEMVMDLVNLCMGDFYFTSTVKQVLRTGMPAFCIPGHFYARGSCADCIMISSLLGFVHTISEY